MSENTVVYFDGSCPLCVNEIGLLKRLDRRGRIRFEDVSNPNATPHCAIDRQQLMARFHVKRPDGVIVDGAEAFTEAWSNVPGLSFVKFIGRNPAARAVLNAIYAAFLRIRPALQRLAKRDQSRSAKRAD